MRPRIRKRQVLLTVAIAAVGVMSAAALAWAAPTITGNTAPPSSHVTDGRATQACMTCHTVIAPVPTPIPVVTPTEPGTGNGEQADDQNAPDEQVGSLGSDETTSTNEQVGDVNDVNVDDQNDHKAADNGDDQAVVAPADTQASAKHDGNGSSDRSRQPGQHDSLPGGDHAGSSNDGQNN